MTLDNIGLFQAMGAKMQYLNHRQEVISQNVANANTPGYRPQELSEVDFGSVLQNVQNGGDIYPATSDPGHMGGGAELGSAEKREDDLTYEVAPSGNAVVMEEQLMKSRRTQMDYTMMLRLMQKSKGMIQTALRAPGG
jgi:flagellar basal-body rod protein FlgB